MKHQGFTLIELLIVVSIIVIVFGLSIANFNAFNRRERLRQAALDLKSTLRYAQTRAISVEKPSADCTTFVGLQVNFVIIATDSTYSISHTCSDGLVGESETVTFPKGITYVTLPSPFVFYALTRTTDLASDQTIRLTNSVETYAIQITTNGEVNDLGFQ